MNEHPISDDERARRQKAIDFARTNIELSGFTPSPAMAALGVRFVAGELSESDFIAAALAHANSLPASEPAQEYFASLEQLEAARAARDRP
ncbi:antitoxin VbhA family protein [Sphingobium sp. Ndbn-10]|uniref:antitoxin VbhA family protein n=1 Tax=Sphingobium sp. Ndbn-10 TaxID=1667223 RepID=UPI0008188533|nr:antitoxin VbhA family protein [Sphingobium sp. Ndbn-10]